MANHRRRLLLYAGVGLAAVWLLAGAGFFLSHQSKVTAEKVAVYLRQVDLARLSGEARAKALRELAQKMTALPPEERRKARVDGSWDRWFTEMTDAEKTEFIEATMPSGFKQMLASFEQLPEDKRRKAVEDSIREMKKTREAVESDEAGSSLLQPGTNRPPALSEEIQQKVVKIGLKTFYSDSSAQSKAELAPLLEEMQRQMERGTLFRGPRRDQQ